ncbi:MAG: hypothetical protein ACREQ7_24535, partial [Candidatus Binatia bacterium]
KAQRDFDKAQKDLEAARQVRERFARGKNDEATRDATQREGEAQREFDRAKDNLNKRNADLKKGEEAWSTADKNLAEKEKEEQKARADLERAEKTASTPSQDSPTPGPGAPAPVSVAGLNLQIAHALNEGKSALDNIQALKNCEDALKRLYAAMQELAHIAGLGLLGPRNVALQSVGASALSALNQLAARWKALEDLWVKNCGKGAVCVRPGTGTTIVAAGSSAQPPEGDRKASGEGERSTAQEASRDGRAATEEEEAAALEERQREIAAQAYREISNRSQVDLQGTRVRVGTDSYLLVHDEMRMALWMLRRARQVELIKSLANLSQFKLKTEETTEGNLTQTATESSFTEAVDRLDQISRRLPVLREALTIELAKRPSAITSPTTERARRLQEQINSLEAERNLLLSTEGVDKAAYDNALRELSMDLRTKSKPIGNRWKTYVQALKEEAEFTGRLDRAQWQRYLTDRTYRESFPAYQNLQRAKEALQRSLEGNALLAMEVDVEDSFGIRRSGYLFNVLNDMGELQPNAAQRAIDQAIANLEENIANEEIRIKALRTVEEVAGEFGKEIYRPLRESVAQVAQPIFVADPSFWMGSIERMVRLQEEDRAYGEAKTDLILMGAEATVGLASIFFPPAALVEAGLIITQVVVQGNRLVLSYRELATQQTAVDAGGTVSRVGLGTAEKAIEQRWGTFVETLAVTPVALAGSAASFADAARAGKQAGGALDQAGDISRASSAADEAMASAPPPAAGAAPPAPSTPGGGPRSPQSGGAATASGGVEVPTDAPAVKVGQGSTAAAAADDTTFVVSKSHKPNSDLNFISEGGEKVSLKTGETIAGGGGSTVYVNADDPTKVIRVTRVEGMEYAPQLDEFGRKVVESLETQTDAIRVAKQYERYNAQSSRGSAFTAVEVNERLPGTAKDLLAQQGGKMTPGQARAFDQATRELNSRGYAWLDNHHNNYTFEQLAGEDNWRVVVMDAGGIVPMKAGNGRTAAENARAIQSRLNNPPQELVDNINQFPRFRDNFSEETAVGIREDFKDLFDLEALGVDTYKAIEFRADGVINYPEVQELFQRSGDALAARPAGGAGGADDLADPAQQASAAGQAGGRSESAPGASASADQARGTGASAPASGNAGVTAGDPRAGGGVGAAAGAARAGRYVLHLQPDGERTANQEQPPDSASAGGRPQPAAGPFVTMAQCSTRIYMPIPLPWGGFLIPFDTNNPGFFKNAATKDKRIGYVEENKEFDAQVMDDGIAVPFSDRGGIPLQ